LTQTANSSEKIWFAVIDNKADGPHTQDEIQNMLNAGKLNFTDFAFKPGLDQWTPLSEFKEYERRSPAPAADVTKTFIQELPQDKNMEGWVLLAKHKAADGKENVVQSGPYTEDQIRDKLTKQEINYDDMVWQRGFTEWKKLGALDTFDRRRPKNFETQPKPDFSKENTVIMDIPGMKSPEAKSASAAPQSTPQASNKNPEPPLLKKPSSKKLMIAGIGAGLCMLFAYVGLNAYKQAVNEEKNHGIKPHSINQPEVKTYSKAAPVVAAPPTPVLKVLALKANTPSNPQLAFETNMPVGSMINVDIAGEPGQILNYPRLNLKKEVRVIAGQMPTLDLTHDDLPAGDYEVTVASGTLKSQATIKVGVHDETFSKRIQAYRAQLVAQEKKEREALTGAAQLLASNQNGIQKLYSKAAAKKDKKKIWGKAYADLKKKYSKKAQSYVWLDKQNPKTLIYPVAQSKYLTAKAKMNETEQSYKTKIAGGRGIASGSGDDSQRALNDLRLELKNLKFTLKK
jgi:hypothetical protein